MYFGPVLFLRLQSERAYGFVKKYAEEKQAAIKNSEVERLVRWHYRGKKNYRAAPRWALLWFRRGMIYFEFTPLQHPADKKESGVVTTHFEYHAIGGPVG